MSLLTLDGFSETKEFEDLREQCHVRLANQTIKESYNHHMTRLGHKDQESNDFFKLTSPTQAS